GRDGVAAGEAADLVVDGGHRFTERVSDRPHPQWGRGGRAAGRGVSRRGRVGPLVGLQSVPGRAAGAPAGGPSGRPCTRRGGGEAEPIGRWGLAESERLFALWRRFRAGEFDRPALRRRLIPLQARLGRLLRRGQANPDRKAAALCRQLQKWWTALWTFARVES